MFQRGGVNIRHADGGFIVSWSEKVERDESKAFTGGHPDEYPSPRMLMAPFKHREAVRTTVEDALKLAGKVLKENKLGQDDDEVGEYIAGA